MPNDWEEGDVILDLYEVTKILGEGGMGRVCKVRHKSWNIDLAVKSPKPHIFARADGQENFIREAETWIKLGLHPHIVSCFYVRTIDGIPRVFAEYVGGGSLSDWIKSRKLYEGGHQQALARMLDVAIQFAWGLDYAHEQGVVHQDVKPANVMMTEGGIVRVTDFGLARARTLAGDTTTQGTAGQSVFVPGSGFMTRAYCSPEQATGKPMTRKTDIWSWGLSVLEMFAGGSFWADGKPAGLKVGQLASEALDHYLSEGTAEVSIPLMPQEVAALLKRCFQREPSARPATMRKIADELQDIYARETGEAYSHEMPKAAEALADSLNNRAVSLLDLGKQDDAIRLWHKAVELHSRHLEANFNLGVMRWRLGELTDTQLLELLADQHFDTKSVETKDFLLASIHIERGDFSSAITILERFSEKYLDYSEVVRALTHAKLRQAEAEKNYVKVVEEKENTIFSVSARVDHHVILTGGKDGCLRLWDITSGQCLRIFKGHTEPVNSVYLSEDGELAVSGSGTTDAKIIRQLPPSQEYLEIVAHLKAVGAPHWQYPQSHAHRDYTVRLWDTATGECLSVFARHRFVVNCVSLSKDKRWILSAGGDELILWDRENKALVRSLPIQGYHTNQIIFTKDNHFAFTAHDQNTIFQWDLITGRQVRQFRIHDHSRNIVDSICLSPDEKLLLAGYTQGYTFCLWEIASGHCIRFLHDDTGSTSVCLSKNGKLALTGGDKIRLWDIESGRSLRTFDKGGLPVSLNTEENTVVVRQKRSSVVELYLLKSPLESKEFYQPRLSELRSYEDISSQDKQTIKLLDKAENALLQEQLADAISIIDSFHNIPRSEWTHRTHELWKKIKQQCGTGKFFGANPTTALQGHLEDVGGLDLSMDGNFVLTGSDDKTVRLWEVISGTCKKVFAGHKAQVLAVCLGSNNHLAFSADLDGTIRMWDTRTSHCVRTLDEYSGFITSLAISPNQKLLLSGAQNETVRLWNIATGECLKIFKGHTERVNSVRWLPDGQRFVSASHDKTIRLWDITSSACQRVFEGHDKLVSSCAVSSDGKYALSGSWDNTLRLWDINTGYSVRTIGRKGYGQITSVSLSRNGRLALSGIYGQVHLWDVVTGDCLYSFSGFHGRRQAVALSPDGFLAIFSDGHTAQIWELDWELTVRDISFGDIVNFEEVRPVEHQEALAQSSKPPVRTNLWRRIKSFLGLKE